MAPRAELEAVLTGTEKAGYKLALKSGPESETGRGVKIS
jgi:hypothetical protein